MNNAVICDEIFIPKMRKVIYGPKELEAFVKLYNGKKNIYNSVYHYHHKPNAANAIVDKIFLDFDYDNNMIFFDDVRNVVETLHNLDIKHCIRFSGRGFHVFVFLSMKTPSKNTKRAIRGWVKDLHKSTKTESDMSVVGDTRRVCRTLYTKNLKSQLYCIPISYDKLMNSTYDEICYMAKFNVTNTKGDDINGNVLLDISEYDDVIVHQCNTPPVSISDIEIDTEFPPCVQRLLTIKDLGWHERRELIIYLRDDGYTFDEILEILEKTLSAEKFYHCVYEEHQVDYLLERTDILFSSCKTQKINQICASDTCEGNNLYL